MPTGMQISRHPRGRAAGRDQVYLLSTHLVRALGEAAWTGPSAEGADACARPGPAPPQDWRNRSTGSPLDDTIEDTVAPVPAGPIPPLPRPLPTDTPLCGGQTDSRRLILYLVRQEPGIRASVLASCLNIHKNAVDHHLMHLERIGAIHILPGPCRRPVAPEHKGVPPAVLCPHGRAILDCLWRLGPSSLRSLAHGVRISTTKAAAILGQLVHAGYVVDHGATRGRFAAIGPRRRLAGYALSIEQRHIAMKATFSIAGNGREGREGELLVQAAAAEGD